MLRAGSCNFESILKLPPHVRGPVNSFLDLTIEVSWTTVKKFGEVKIKLIWWGQSEGLFCERNVKTRYQICTSHSLWQLYLKHAEPFPLQIQFYSLKSLSLIATSKISWNSESGFAIVADIIGHSHKLGELSVQVAEILAKQAVRMPCSTNKSAHTDTKNLHIIGKSKKILSRIHKPLFLKMSAKNPPKQNIPTSPKSCGQNGFRKILKMDCNTLEQDKLMASLAILKATFEPDTQQKIQQFIIKSQLRKFISKCAVTSNFFSDEYSLSPVFEIVPSSKFYFYR